MPKMKDMTGMKFGFLTAVHYVGSIKSKTIWKCVCICGEYTDVQQGNLISGITKSCGCKTKEMIGKRTKTHNMSKTPEYKTWQGIKARCYNPNEPQYEYYGGRGIVMSEEWVDSFENFYIDMGKRPSDKHTIDRIDVNGNYCKSNCRWETHIEQSRNRRVMKNNKSGVSGVSWHKRYNKWVSVIKIDPNKNKHLGYYSKLDDAIQARKEAELNYWGYTKIV